MQKVEEHQANYDRAKNEQAEAGSGAELSAAATGDASRKRGRDDDGSDNDERSEGEAQGRPVRRQRTSYTSSLLRASTQLLGYGAAGYAGVTLGARECASYESAYTCLDRLSAPVWEAAVCGVTSLVKYVVTRSHSFVG